MRLTGGTVTARSAKLPSTGTSRFPLERAISGARLVGFCTVAAGHDSKGVLGEDRSHLDGDVVAISGRCAGADLSD
jgi:hypothetical protein